MRAYLFNASTKYYNRGLIALSYWLQERGYRVEISTRQPDLFSLNGNLFAFSAVFTWDLPRLVEWVNRVKDFGEVWIGGPAASAMPRYVKQQTGIDPVIGVDTRIEQQPGHYKMTRTSRGCPVGCSFCIVPKIDGTSMLEYPDFSPAPVIMDDNILACSVEHQERVIERTLAQGYRAVDMNSGFEPHYFDYAAFERFRRLPLKFWRLGFDEVKEEPAAREMIRLLKQGGIDSRHIRVYCLIGNEPFENCHYRAERIIEWGAEPHVQPLIPLNALEKTPVVQRRYGWTAQRLSDFARYYNRWLWRKPGRTLDWYDNHFRAKQKDS